MTTATIVAKAIRETSTTSIVLGRQMSLSPFSHLLFQREYPDRAAFGHGTNSGHGPLDRAIHTVSIAAPARQHGDVLLAVDQVGGNGRLDAAAGRKFPQHFAVFRVERADHTIVGAAAND